MTQPREHERRTNKTIASAVGMHSIYETQLEIQFYCSRNRDTIIEYVSYVLDPLFTFNEYLGGGAYYFEKIQ